MTAKTKQELLAKAIKLSGESGNATAAMLRNMFDRDLQDAAKKAQADLDKAWAAYHQA